MNTFERLRCIVADQLNTTVERITPETAPTNDLNANSLDMIEIAMAIEDSFKIEFGEETISLTTMQEIVDYIDAKTAEKR